MSAFVPATSIWQVNEHLQFDEPLAPNDPRWVDTAQGRGEFSFNRLYRMLGVDQEASELKGAPAKAYVLFCGHRGSGKSTELRRVHERLNQPNIFFSVLLDATSALDPNNLQYQDVLLALATALLEQLPSDIGIDDVHLRRLQSWFDERVLTHQATREFAAEIKSGAELQAGVPLLAKLFTALTTAFRVNSTYKDELRTVVRNHFSEFADAFNQFIKAAEKACAQINLGQRVVFIVDGTDRLRGEDAENFFVRDVHQLQLISALFVYTAPIHLIHAGVDLNQAFTGTFKLPMVKLRDRDGTRNGAGARALRRLVYRRAPEALFDSEATVDFLVEHSGGHPRDLLRLLQYTFENATGDLFDARAAERAVDNLASEYRVFLDAEDFELLYQIDQHSEREHSSERVRYLLYNLALLEYESYWWKSHPVIRTLEAYRRLATAASG